MKKLDRSYIAEREREYDEPLGLMSGIFVLIAMVIVTFLVVGFIAAILDYSTGFDLHNLLAEVMTSGV